MATNVTLKRVTNADGTTTDIHPTTDWSQIESKPSTFAPTSHTHSEYAKRIDLTSQVQLSSYRKSVIALCNLDNTVISRNSWSGGTIFFHRTNGLNAPVTLHITMEKRYNAEGANYTAMALSGNSFGDNIQYVKFDYNGNTYGGIEFYFTPAEHAQVYFIGESNFDIFGLDYYNTNTNTVLNSEVNNSISTTDMVAETDFFINNQKIFHEGNDGSTSGLDAQYLQGIPVGSFLRSDAADTASGQITFTGGLVASGGISGLDISNGISGSNFNITNVNQIEFNDPGEGIRFKSGSSGTMDLKIIDDSNDNILEYSGSNAKFRVAGSLDIKSSNPLLTLEDTGTTTGNAYIDYQAGTSLKVHAGGDALTFVAGNAERARIASNGKVGIGTTSPGRQLEVNGEGVMRLDATSGDPGIDFQTAGTQDMQFRYRASSDYLGVYSYGTTSDVMAIRKATGNVGIGTISPGEKLHIAGNIKTSGNLVFDDDADNSDYLIDFHENTTGTFGAFIKYDGASANALKIGTRSSGTDIEAIHIARDDGDVGIGTAVPLAKLTVKGDEGLYITTENNAPTDGAQIRFSDHSSQAQYGFIRYKHANQSVETEPVNSDDGFIIGGSETNTVVSIQGALNVEGQSNFENQVEIDSGNLIVAAGNVGIGDTTPSYKLEVAGDIAVNKIFDRNNGSYYLDPASTSVINALNVQRLEVEGAIFDTETDQLRMPFPKGGYYTNGSSNVTGAIEITLPSGTHGNYSMISFFVDVYDYAGGADGESFTIHLGGYVNGTTWTNTFANMVAVGRTDRFFNVRYNVDGTANKIYIAETTNNWSYPKIQIRDLMAGHSGGDDADWYNNAFTIDITTTIDGTTAREKTLESVATWADQVDTNSSSSSSYYNLLWHSGDTVYYAAGNKLRVQPSTGNIQIDGDNVETEEFASTYTTIASNGWNDYALGRGIFSRSDSSGLPSGGTHGYWLTLGRRDVSGGYAGIYVNDYSTSGSGVYIGRNDNGGNPTWEKVWTDKTDGTGSGLSADNLRGYVPQESASANSIAKRDGNGDLRVRDIRADGAVYANFDQGNVDAYVYFADTGSQTAHWIRFDTSAQQFGLSNRLVGTAGRLGAIEYNGSDVDKVNFALSGSTLTITTS